MDFINGLIDNYNIPILSAFLLGILMSISPCPLATNITAIAYISKEIKSPKKTLLNGLLYTTGRVFAYSFLATLIYFGLSSFKIATIFQSWGNKVLGILLILISLVMFEIIKIKINDNKKIENLKSYFLDKGYLGSFMLGILFSLAFCPYSGVLFFGVLIPLVVKSIGGFMLAPIFALGTALPVIIFSFLLAFSLEKVGKAFNIIQKIEKKMRYSVATLFMVVGVYYVFLLIK